ncbi:MAG: tRNA 2-thiocytidine(32) synthetase TtcA [Clostridia bacterium]|nr:tRNA 2-thiocytidine(32) synthetase TtcA [Clostridia bacterium]
MRKILGAMRRAINDYSMIKDGDRIVVGVSGGKDSMLLFYALTLYKAFSPQKFELFGVHIDMGFERVDMAEMIAMQEFFAKHNTELIIEKTNIAEIIFDIRKESSPCSLCSKMRRGALCTKANELNANKIALAHHADDVLETMLMSFIYEGRLSVFAPQSYMDRTDVTVIRPFVYVEEGDIRGAVKRNELPILFNPCPVDKHTKREYMKKLVAKICEDVPFAKDRMISALEHPERYNLWQKPDSYK